MTDVLALLEEIAAIGRIGLAYATNVYDRQRYEQLLEIAVREYGTALSLPPDDVREPDEHTRRMMQLGLNA